MQMYGQMIKTSLSVLGFTVHIQYKVNQNRAIWWNLDLVYYGDYEDMEIPGPGIELLELMLRVYMDKYMREAILTEFDARMYAEQERMAALADIEWEKANVQF
jgi:hypothetical protein